MATPQHDHTASTHEIIELLCRVGVMATSSLELFHHGVRDDANIDVLRCRQSGVIVLASIAHASVANYETHSTEYWNVSSLAEARARCYVDDARRAAALRDELRGRRVIDVGCGAAGFGVCALAAGGGELNGAGAPLSVALVEPSLAVRQAIEADAAHFGAHFARAGIHARLRDVPARAADVITLFHVLEHFCEPLDELRAAHAALDVGGRLVVEVPHARDFLLHHCDAFRRFTLWSQHLVLHTRDSLRRLLEAAGFRVLTITGIQRYPVANHFGWLLQGKPGGHERAFAHMQTPALARAYADMLERNEETDTLWAVAMTH